MMPVVSNDLFIFFDLFSISLFKIVKEKELCSFFNARLRRSVNMYVIWRCEAGLLDDCISFLLHYVWARFASSILFNVL